MDRPPYSLGQLVAYFLGLGTYGFGGPVALVGYMHRDLVERRGWIAEPDYREGMALAQLAPGPLAAQLAIYIGYVHYRVLGATLVGLAFVLPSFLMVLALGWAYVGYGGLTWMRAVFYGVAPAVIGIIAYSAYKLTRKTIGQDWLLWLVYLASAVATVVTQRELVWLVLASGLLVWLVKTPPRLSGTASLAVPLGLSLPAVPVASNQTLWQIAVFFTEAGAFVFGSGLAIIPFLYGGVVTDYKWLNDDQFLDAVAVAMITLGPVVITVAFIGYLVAGLSGASIAAVATFLPCYFFTILPAPYFRKYGKRPGIVAFVDGVTAAAIGAISGAVVVLGQRMIVDEGRPDLFKVGLMLATLAVYASGRRIPEPLLVLAAALVGLVAYPMLH
ncbi:MAG TPA: chromate transporter [Lacipirellulaceae bacterium]|nr:chromate transporter [Lacipirellulaceae bacterium]